MVFLQEAHRLESDHGDDDLPDLFKTKVFALEACATPICLHITSIVMMGCELNLWQIWEALEAQLEHELELTTDRNESKPVSLEDQDGDSAGCDFYLV